MPPPRHATAPRRTISADQRARPSRAARAECVVGRLSFEDESDASARGTRSVLSRERGRSRMAEPRGCMWIGSASTQRTGWSLVSTSSCLLLSLSLSPLVTCLADFDTISSQAVAARSRLRSSLRFSSPRRRKRWMTSRSAPTAQRSPISTRSPARLAGASSRLARAGGRSRAVETRALGGSWFRSLFWYLLSRST